MDPFARAITIASAVSVVYRQNFLKPNTIGIIPEGGYRRTDKFSIIAMKWLKWVSKVENIQIQHALNGGEFRVGKYRVDGKFADTIFEFNGCAVHGCLCLPNREMKLPLSSMTADEAYQRTLDRKQFLENQGYTVHEMWECELQKQLRRDPEMKRCTYN